MASPRRPLALLLPLLLALLAASPAAAFYTTAVDDASSFNTVIFGPILNTQPFGQPPTSAYWEIVSAGTTDTSHGAGTSADVMFEIKYKGPGAPSTGTTATLTTSCTYDSAGFLQTCTPSPAKARLTYTNTDTNEQYALDYALALDITTTSIAPTPGPPVTVVSLRITATNTLAGTAAGDPHLVGFRGHRYEFCEKDDGAACKGRPFALVSEASHQLNVLVDRHAGPDAWPHAGAWMTAFGFKFGTALALELGMRTDVAYSVVPDAKRGPDATRAAPVAGGFRELLAFARVNGQDAIASGWLESGHTMQLPGGASVHFPSSKHPHDPASGPVAVIVTPSMKVTLLIEAGDVWHLDFQVSLLADGITMHGLLGQSLHWDSTTAKAEVEGNELQYIVKDGLLGHDFAFSLFGLQAGGGALKTLRRLLLNGHVAHTAGLSAGGFGSVF